MINKQEFIHFISVVESGEMGLEIGDIHLYYFIVNNQLQIISEFRPGEFYDRYYSDSMSVLTMDIAEDTTDIKEILAVFLKEFIISPHIHNYPHYIKSSLFTKTEYNDIRDVALN
jgi:hypothetical protein